MDKTQNVDGSQRNEKTKNRLVRSQLYKDD